MHQFNRGVQGSDLCVRTASASRERSSCGCPRCPWQRCCSEAICWGPRVAAAGKVTWPLSEATWESALVLNYAKGVAVAPSTICA
eukprot:6466234-Amphidinium_carterae.2